MKTIAVRWPVAAGVLLVVSALAVTVYAAAPVTLTNVTGEAKKKTLGADKDTWWLKVTTDITVAEKVAKLMTLKVNATCKNGADTATENANLLGAGLDKLEAGGTKAKNDIRVFFDKGKGTKFEPKSCDLVFTFGKSKDVADAAAVATMCWNGSAIVDGACK